MLRVYTTALGSALLLGSPAAFAQSPRSVNTSLQEVTVYLNRAQLTNTASTTVEAGTSTLLLTGLPSQLDPQSLSVDLKGNVVLQGITFQANFLKPGQKPKNIVTLEDSLQYYQEQARIHNDQRDVLSKEETMIVTNQKIGGNEKGVDPDDLEVMADFFRNRLTNIRNRQIEHDRALRRLNRHIERLNNQLSELNNRPEAPTGEVLLSLSAEGRTPVDLAVSYVVYNAGWSPLYEIRASDTKGPVKLSYKANVVQNTGINWRSVKMTLSTGNPSIGASKPELDPWYLQVREKSQASRYRMKAEESMSPAVMDSKESAGGAAVMAKPQAATLADFTSVDASGINAEFKVGLPVTVPSNGKPQVVDLQQYEVKASYQYYAVPKLDPDAFLLAQVTGWEKYNLLPGQVNTYFGGSFAGKSQIDPLNTNDTLPVSMGRDKRVVITREKKKDLKSKGIFGGSVKETTGYEIMIRNTKSEPVEIIVEDQIPVSNNREIEVEALELTNGKLDKDTGKVTWALKIPSNDTKRLQLKFEVKYPKGRVVAGI